VRERPRWPEAAVRARKRWGRSEVGDEGADEGVSRVFERAWSAARLRGKRRREVGVVSGHGGCHAAWGLAPTVSRTAVTWARRACAVRRCSDRGTLGADGRAPVAVREGRERRGARACLGRPEKKTGWPSPDEQFGFGFI
jgi:hypothetical protein